MIEVIKVDNYKCKCGKIYPTEIMAEVCCKQYVCEICGKETVGYVSLCDEHIEKKKFERATKMTLEEYGEKFPDNIFYFGDTYYHGIEECLESLQEAAHPDKFICPDYVWGTEEYDVEIDCDSVVEDMVTNSQLEDFEVEQVGYKELAEFLQGWNEKHGTTAYMACDIAVLIPEELKEEYW